MFDIFRKKRIVRYTEGASGYVARTYVPEMSPKEDPSVKHSPEKAEPDIKYSERGDVLYSHRGADDIPAQGDNFRKEAVGELFARYSLNNGSLSKKLEFTLNLTFVDMLIRYINKKGWRDTKVYKAAQIDRRLFSKIMSDREYKPSKDTALHCSILPFPKALIQQSCNISLNIFIPTWAKTENLISVLQQPPSHEIPLESICWLRIR